MGDRQIPSSPVPPPPPIVFSKRSTCAGKIKGDVVCNLKAIAESKGGENVNEDEVTRRLVQHLIDSEQSQGRTPVLVSHRQHVPPLVQEGPQCGLVALCMASSLLQCDTISIEEAVSCARDMGYTLQGEMFSAENMTQLAKHLRNCEVDLVHGQERRERIISALLRSQLVLIPYDKDHNNEPCCRKGHKAHWAALTGILVLSGTELTIEEADRLTQDSQLPQLFHAEPSHRADSGLSSANCPSPLSEQCHHDAIFQIRRAIDRQLDSSSTHQVYVYAVQGKSIHMHLWSLEALLESNSNICELDPKIENNRDQFIVPAEGIKHGLCDQVLILRNSDNWLSA